MILFQRQSSWDHLRTSALYSVGIKITRPYNFPASQNECIHHVKDSESVASMGKRRRALAVTHKCVPQTRLITTHSCGKPAESKEIYTITLWCGKRYKINRFLSAYGRAPEITLVTSLQYHFSGNVIFVLLVLVRQKKIQLEGDGRGGLRGIAKNHWGKINKRKERR